MSSLQDVLAVVVATVYIFASATQSKAVGYYVDYSGGADSNAGTDTSVAWQHCPGDSLATGTAGSTPLNPGDTVFFKGGVSYVLAATNPTPGLPMGGIALNWSGAAGNPITYDGNSAGNWGSGRAILTDNYSSNNIVAFFSGGGISNINFTSFEFGPIGGAEAPPPDPGQAVAANPGTGIQAYGGMTNVSIANCYFHDLGYWFYTAPMSVNSIAGYGIFAVDSASVTITNCEFTRISNPITWETTVSSTNLTIVGCNFHNDIVLAINLSIMSGARDSIFIQNNTFHDWDLAYTNWTGYGTPPDHDGVLDNSSTLSFVDGPNIDIYNNTFYDTTTNNAGGTACINFTGNTSGNVYNNLFIDAPESGGFVVAKFNSAVVSNALVRIYNNTFYQDWLPPVDVNNGDPGQTNSDPQLTGGTGDVVDMKNNIHYDALTGSSSNVAINILSSDFPSWTLDYNCYWYYNTQGYMTYWYPGTNPPDYWLPFSSLQSVGWETHGQNNDPQFVSLTYGSWSPNSISNNYHLAASSPCIGAGTNLSALGLPGLNTDIKGNLRPTSGPWDIGAYEYNTNSVPPSPPVASFGATPTSGTAPLTVTFTDTSTGSITSRSWRFGNGNVTNTTATTLTYQYATVGTDTVQLVVSGPGGSSTNTQANLITVNAAPQPPVAAFSAAPTSGTAPLTVTFTDTSTGSIASRFWRFGNGKAIITTATTVTYQYATVGTDTVQLIVRGPGGSSTNTQPGLIVVNPLPAPSMRDTWRILSAH